MNNLFRRWGHAALTGLLVGVLAGIALEFARRAHNQSATDEITRRVESQGMSPLMVDMLKPWAVPVWTTISFILLALLAYAIVAYIRQVVARSNAA